MVCYLVDNMDLEALHSTALVLSLPYGALADKIGRKFVLLSSMAGLLLSNIWFLIVCSSAKA